jgi:hypothetical protein
MLILNFTYPLRCLRVPPVEYHCSTRNYMKNVNTFSNVCYCTGHRKSEIRTGDILVLFTVEN